MRPTGKILAVAKPLSDKVLESVSPSDVSLGEAMDIGSRLVEINRLRISEQGVPGRKCERRPPEVPFGPFGPTSSSTLGPGVPSQSARNGFLLAA